MAIIKKESITIRVTPRFKRKLEKIAEFHKRTVSDYIRLELEKLSETKENIEILSKTE